MTAQEFFYIIVSPQTTRTEILNCIDMIIPTHSPEWIDALLADLADLLFQWQCEQTLNQAKREHDEMERQHRAEYDKRYSEYEEEMRRANYCLAMGTNGEIEWPEAPEDYEPLRFIPPYPGKFDNIQIPAMYNYTVEILKRRYIATTDKKDSDTLNLPSEIDIDRAREYFTRAVEAGYMTDNGTSAQWLSAVVRLGYMCYKIYSQPRPIASLEKYFGVTKLSASITQASFEANRADVKKWRAEIDNKIFFD